ncbi:hypothetical protein D1BOALGB6SA_7027 [Olavius sp. associated proteobacterium Delta 1]|nr:hypothetical protein D1BOALGB6SA_7027 [Olavius sp. associated proteobacterium Delta 1]
MRLRLIATLKRLNVEHRTSNVEHPILMAPRFIYLISSGHRFSNVRSAFGLRSLFGEAGLLSLFKKIDRSTLSFDPEVLEEKLTAGRIHYFDIRYLSASGGFAFSDLLF